MPARPLLTPLTLTSQPPQPVSRHVRAELHRRQDALSPGARCLFIALFALTMVTLLLPDWRGGGAAAPRDLRGLRCGGGGLRQRRSVPFLPRYSKRSLSHSSHPKACTSKAF